MRPRTKDVHVILQDELLREIDKVRRNEADIPSMSEAVRRLLRFAITARHPTEQHKRKTPTPIRESGL